MAKIVPVLLLFTLASVFAEGDWPSSAELNREKRELLRRSKRRWVLTTIELTEGDTGKFPKCVSRLFNDKESYCIEKNLKCRYTISGEGVNEFPRGIFFVNETDGRVYVTKSLDREERETYHINFNIYDITNNRMDDQLSFDVEVKDLNDNAPKFILPVQNVSMKEIEGQGKLPITVDARDEDKIYTDNSRIKLTVLSQTPAFPLIQLKEIEGTNVARLTTNGCFDYKKDKYYKVLIMATDHGTPQLSSTAVIHINIQDSNNNAPVFTKEQYQAEVDEIVSDVVILKMAVNDADTPHTPAWNAVYKILQGNEEGNYQIETDPNTNEGILKVIKGKDYEKNALNNLLIAVENEEPFAVCGGTSKSEAGRSTVAVAVMVRNLNDPPFFKSSVMSVHHIEESETRKILGKVEANDDETPPNMMRYKLAEDPANWVSVNEQTGEITAVKKMDRESPYVNNSIYTVVIHGIDNGKPPLTATGTVNIHLADINDHTPYLSSKNLHLCTDSDDNSVIVVAKDQDIEPYAGPFTFELLDKGKGVQENWKLGPSNENGVTLVRLKQLANGIYTVPLRIEDKQGLVIEEDLYVQLCDCGKEKVCKALKRQTSGLGGAAIGLVIAGVLLFILLLALCLMCECKEKFYPIQIDPRGEGNQTLIKYNEEGGTFCQAGQTALFTPVIVPQHSANPVSSLPPWSGFRTDEYDSLGTIGHTMSPLQSHQSMWSSHTHTKEGTMKYYRSKSMRTAMERELTMRLCNLAEKEIDYQGYGPRIYTYEGQGSQPHSLDQLSMFNSNHSLHFMADLDSKFNTLGEICQQTMQEKGLKL
ncbi:cadherin-like protein 26 [Amia ocellicauda]|uniref:cadherin-like protein 26 n=1 Tax=Amia ocellicauda TaxID=2972642 RepID=UPI00346411B5